MSLCLSQRQRWFDRELETTIECYLYLDQWLIEYTKWDWFECRGRDLWLHLHDL